MLTDEGAMNPQSIRALLAFLPAALVVFQSTAADASERVQSPEAPPPANSSPKERPIREGFTLELGLGGAMTVVSREVGTVTYDRGHLSSTSSNETSTHSGFAPLSLGIGGFITEDWALLFRASGTSFFQDERQWLNVFSGIAVQYWPTDRFMLGAGIGIGTFMTISNRSSSDQSENRGLALSARAGYSVVSGQSNALRLAIELTPAYYEHSRVTGVAMGLEWQLL